MTETSRASSGTDLRSDDRWPTSAAATLERTPVRGLMSFHLTDTPTRTALTR